VIVLFALLAIILTRDFGFISSRHFYAALLIWSIGVMALQALEGCWQRRQHGYQPRYKPGIEPPSPYGVKYKSPVVEKNCNQGLQENK
jgi:hypothetical protein